MKTNHPEPVEDSHAKAVIDWEPLGQIDPSKLPEPSEKYPGPWTVAGRGNGHMDVFDAKGRYFAHVYLWDKNDGEVFEAKIAASIPK